MSSSVMKFVNYVVGIVSAVLLLFNISAPSADKGQLDLSKFNLTFEDEFDGDILDSSVWRAHNSFGVRRGGYWSGEQLSVRDGNLIIRTEYRDGEFGSGYYTSGISTRGTFEQTYGYFECRCILPKGEGLWSAFWLTNSNVTKLTTGDALQGAEIDVFESPYYYRGDGKNNLVSSNIHYNGYELMTRYKNVGIFKVNDPYNSYNTYGVEWNADGYTFYINGVKAAFSNYGKASQADEFMVLSCEVDGVAAEPVWGWSGDIENNDELPADFIVDYVRVYQYK